MAFLLVLIEYFCRMKMLSVTILFFLLIANACHTNTGQPKAGSPTVDTGKFYPIQAFFKSQVEYVDLRNYPIYKITVKDGKKDSAQVSKDQFIALAKIFLDRSISSPGIKALYKETVFHDLATRSITLNYSPTNPDAEVQNIDVLLDEETNNVKRIFIRSAYQRGDTVFTEQCSWKAFKSFRVNRELQTKNGYHSTELNFINWNDTPWK